VPGSPLPLLSVACVPVDGQVSTTPVVVSVSMSLPDFAETGPPGWTVHVVVVAVVAPTVAATATKPAITMPA
jgi:hypothetical protein